MFVILFARSQGILYQVFKCTKIDFRVLFGNYCVLCYNDFNLVIEGVFIMKGKIKWVLSVLIIVCVIVLSATTANASTDLIRIGSDDAYVYIVPTPGYVESRGVENHVFVPVRAFFEILGAHVVWYEELRTAWIYIDGSIGIWLQPDVMFWGVSIHDRDVNLDARLQIINDRIYIPLSFFTRDLGIDADFIDRVVVSDLDNFPYQSGAEEWQNAYAALLLYYARRPIEQFVNLSAHYLEYWDNRRFILHDINQDGIPELFVLMRHISAHHRFYAIYTFSDGEAIPLEFDRAEFGHSAVLAPSDNSPWIILSRNAGVAWAHLIRVKMDGNTLGLYERGFYSLSPEGHDRIRSEEPLDNLEWWIFHLNGESVGADEFEAIFGGFWENNWREEHAITADNIISVIFGH